MRKCTEIKTNAVFAAKIMRKRRVARGVATADIGTQWTYFKSRIGKEFVGMNYYLIFLLLKFQNQFNCKVKYEFLKVVQLMMF